MGRHRRVDHEKVVAMYIKGYTPREVGAHFDLHPDYVSLLVRKSGKSRGPGRPKRRHVCQDCGSQNVKAEIL